MSVFEYEASVFFVGGTGSKAGSGNSGGCTRAWLDGNFSELADIMGSNGAPLIAETGCTYDDDEGRITKASAGEFAGAEVGMVAYISDGDVDITTDRYEITDVDPSGDWVEVSNIDADDNATGVTINIGGAFDDRGIRGGHAPKRQRGYFQTGVAQRSVNQLWLLGLGRCGSC